MNNNINVKKNLSRFLTKILNNSTFIYIKNFLSLRVFHFSTCWFISIFYTFFLKIIFINNNYNYSVLTILVFQIFFAFLLFYNFRFFLIMLKIALGFSLEIVFAYPLFWRFSFLYFLIITYIRDKCRVPSSLINLTVFYLLPLLLIIILTISNKWILLLSAFKLINIIIFKCIYYKNLVSQTYFGIVKEVLNSSNEILKYKYYVIRPETFFNLSYKSFFLVCSLGYSRKRLLSKFFAWELSNRTTIDAFLLNPVYKFFNQYYVKLWDKTYEKYNVYKHAPLCQGMIFGPATKQLVWFDSNRTISSFINWFKYRVLSWRDNRLILGDSIPLTSFMSLWYSDILGLLAFLTAWIVYRLFIVFF